jgi:hypothetical protein
LAKASDTRARSRPSPRINADRKSYRNRNTATVLDSIFSAGFQACLTMSFLVAFAARSALREPTT